MEKAILKTIIYADIFDYPLKAWEIHKWLIGKKANLRQVEKTIKKKTLDARVKSQEGYLFLKNRKTIVAKRFRRKKQSEKYLKQAKLISFLFKLIPWVKLVGVSGSLATLNSDKKDDIDLFVVTASRRLFLSRLFLLLITSLFGKRRKKGEKAKNISGKICINLLLEEDSLALDNKNIYLAHEVLQMKVLWERNGIYQKYLETNSWAFKYLPNWIVHRDSESRSLNHGRKRKNHGLLFIILNSITDWIEIVVKYFQLEFMGKPKGMERITSSALYFHPEDYGPKILEEFNKRNKRL